MSTTAMNVRTYTSFRSRDMFGFCTEERQLRFLSSYEGDKSARKKEKHTNQQLHMSCTVETLYFVCSNVNLLPSSLSTIVSLYASIAFRKSIYQKRKKISFAKNYLGLKYQPDVLICSLAQCIYFGTVYCRCVDLVQLKAHSDQGWNRAARLGS